jgi:hypothetical protein
MQHAIKKNPRLHSRQYYILILFTSLKKVGSFEKNARKKKEYHVSVHVM